MTDITHLSGYSRLTIVLHWLGAIGTIALFATHESDRGSAAYTFHLSGGALIGILLLWRVARRAWRGFVGVPNQALWLDIVSRIVLWGFLVATIVVVITGYFLPWSLGYPIDIFGFAAIPSPMSFNRDVHEFMEEVHEISGHLFLPLLGLHILGTLKHAIVDRDGVANRIFRSVPNGR